MSVPKCLACGNPELDIEFRDDLTLWYTCPKCGRQWEQIDWGNWRELERKMKSDAAAKKP